MKIQNLDAYFYSNAHFLSILFDNLQVLNYREFIKSLASYSRMTKVPTFV